MPRHSNKSVLCKICKRQKKPSEVLPGDLIRTPIVELIQKQYPQWSQKDYICLDDLNRFRAAYVEDVLERDKGELSMLEEDVLRSLKEQELLSKDLNVEFDKKLTFGERAADKIAEFGGSWRFIMIFAATLFFWIILNTVLLLKKPFDPYPFILLNLVLSCLAAIQAPIIMMSQNRQEAKDRLRSEHDYRVNLKAELEIRNLHEKLDHLITHQWQRLLEIQEIQTDLMEELASRSRRRRSKSDK